MAARDLEGGGDDTDFEGEEAEGGAVADAVGQRVRDGGVEVNRNIDRHPENRYGLPGNGGQELTSLAATTGCGHGLWPGSRIRRLGT